MHIFQLVKAFYTLYSRPKMIIIFCLGFVSGLPLALTASTLGVWLTEAGVNKTSIGLFASVATPYALKFLWEPLVDGLRLPFFHRLGRRRGWLVATQFALMVAIILLGFANPANGAWVTALAACFVAFLSANQDIVIDAYRVEMLKPEEQGAGAAAIVLGYRFGMIASSAGALYLAAYTSWSITYFVMAMLLWVGVITVMLAGEPKPVDSGQWTVDKEKSACRSLSTAGWLREHVITPFADFMTRPGWLTILLFILFYKLADAFMGVMVNPFLIEIGFTKQDIASVVKFYGLIATIIGSFIGGWMVLRIGTMRTLWICGIGHGVTNLMFVLQAKLGADINVLALSITLENITGGMGTAAFVAYISGLVNVRFTATQYALLSSFASFGRTWLSTPAGWVAEQLGWPLFFTFAALLAIPGLVALAYLNAKIRVD